MKFLKLSIQDFRKFVNQDIFIGTKVTAIAGNNGTGKSTILGLLANSSWLKEYKTYVGKPFKGEFSELFSASPENDPTGSKITLEYEYVGVPGVVGFRTAWQDNDTRFRVIPKHETPEGKISEAKLAFPVIYLGLSRLFPIGEADRENIKTKHLKWDSEEDADWFKKNYQYILSMPEDIISVDSIGINELSRKAGMGVTTTLYNSEANSSGQDNLGQILTGILSFKKLKRDLGASWNGGLLVIDELDATLHPAAQKRLMNLLLKESGSVGFQTVFTTHSPVILEEMSKKNAHNPANKPGDIEVAYLTQANRKLKVLRNPTWPQMENDLLVRSIAGQTSAPVGIFSEDAEGRWLAQALLEDSFREIVPHINFVEASFGCTQLFHLYCTDFNYLKNRIIVFDGDVKPIDIETKIPKGLREAANNIVLLPGPTRPETLIYDYLINLPPEVDLWDDLESYGFTYTLLTEEGPNSPAYASYSDERNKYKAWFNDYKLIFEATAVIKWWARDNANKVDEFVLAIHRAYSSIARRTSTPDIPNPMKV